MIRFTLNPKTHQRNAARARRARKKIPVAQARAAREANRAMAALAAKIAGQELNLKAKVIKKHLSHAKVSPRDPVASLMASGNPLPLIQFGARPKQPIHEGNRWVKSQRSGGKIQVKGSRKPKVGVSAIVKKGRGRKTIPGTFIARVPTGKRWSPPGRSGGRVWVPTWQGMLGAGMDPGVGHVGIFIRGESHDSPRGYRGRDRSPIQQLYSLSPVQIIGDHKKHIAKKGRKVYRRRLKHHINRFLGAK